MPPSIRTFIDEWFRMASYAIVMLALSGPPTLAESIKGQADFMLAHGPETLPLV